jgi:sugar-specific transcriptional regulator TrmB
MNEELTILLGSLNCSVSEAQTFLAIFDEPDGVTIVTLANKTNIARPTLYGYVNSLIAKGLIKKGLDDEGSRYHAESLETVSSIFQEKERSLAYARKCALLALESRKKACDAGASHRPKLFFFNQNSASEEVLRDILRSREKEVFWFWPIKDMLSVVSPEIMNYFHEERIKRGIYLHSLWPSEQVVDLRKFPQIGENNPEAMLREIRVLPKSMKTMLGYGIYGNRVGFIASKRESYGFILDSSDLSKTMKNQFLYWWERSDPLR